MFDSVGRLGAVTILSTLLASGQTAYLLQTLGGSDLVGDGGPATSALIAHAEGLAIDPFGGLYIADADGHRIRHLSSGGIISTVAGTGRPGFSGDAGPAIAAQLNTPYGIAADKLGNLYIADLGNARIRRVTRDGVITTIAGGGTLASALADGQLATAANLKAPRNITVDSYSNAYFTDFADHRVWQITPAGTLLRVAGTGSAAFSGDSGYALSGTLNSPAGIVVDSTGTLWIADSGNGRIRKVWRGIITTVGDTGKPGAASSIPLGVPTGVALDSDGSLLIADSGNAQVLRVTTLLQVTSVGQPARDVAVDAAGTVYSCSGSYVYMRIRSGTLSVLAGSGNFSFWGDGGQATLARFNRPAATARDSAGSIYVADTGNHRVRRIAPDGVVFTVAGTGVAGPAGDGGPALSAQLSSPQGLSIDPAGNLWIADTGNHRIRRVDATGRIQTMAGTGLPGFSGDAGLAIRAQLNSPTGLAADSAGNIYVADSANHAVRLISPDGLITTAAGNANRGYSGDGGPPLAATLDSPQALAIHRDGTLFIADTGNRRIRRISTGTALGPGLITTYPANDNAVWHQPRGLAIDDSGRLFISDALDQHVYSIDASGRISTIAGDGLQGFIGDSSDALAGRLDSPGGLTLDPAGNLFLADTGNNRVRKLTPNSEVIAPPPIEAGAALVNAASLQPGPIAPGEIVSIFGAGLTAAGQSLQVLCDNLPATLLFTSAAQLNLQIPYEIGAGPSIGIQVLSGGVLRAQIVAGVAAAAPAFFTTANGVGQAIAVNEDGSLNSESHPAGRGSIVTFYATGEGRRSTSQLPALSVEFNIGDYPADLLYAGAAPGFPGLMQINARVPSGFAASGILPVTLKVGSLASQPGVFIVVK